MGALFAAGVNRLLWPQAASIRLNDIAQVSSIPRTEPSARAIDTASADTVTPGGDFEAITYHSQMQRVSLAVQLQQVRERIAQDQATGSQTVQAEGQQLTFSFFAETRSEELTLFQSRTGAVAQGLDGSRQESYIEASRSVAARFRVSISLSGSVLSGFSRASEALQTGDAAAFDTFLGLTQSALKTPDDIVNAIFELLDGFLGGKGDPQAAFAKFLNALFGSSIAGNAQSLATPNAAQSLSVNLQLEFEAQFTGEIRIQGGKVQQSDPITLDLDGDGIELTSFTEGARFDITGTGRAVNTAFVTGGDAFLAIDRNGSGSIDSGLELFGDQHGAVNGYEELAKLDSNHDGRIDKRDNTFSLLRLFKDNGDGRTAPGELLSLADAGIVALSLDYSQVSMQAAGSNRIAQVASYQRADGSLGRTADAVLSFMA